MDRPAAVSGMSRMDFWYCPNLPFRQYYPLITPLHVLLLTLGGGIFQVPLAIADPSSPPCSMLAARSGDTLPLAAKTQKHSSQPRQTPQTPPNLWWAKDQYDPFAGRLIDRWQVDSENQQVEVIVNRQLWSSLDYLGRYRLVSQLGSITRESRYNLSILNPQNKCLAIYFCQFDMTPYQCELSIDPFYRQGITPHTPKFNNSNP